MKNTVDNLSKSKVFLMCGPAGSGKSTLAKKFESTGMTILSYDEESFQKEVVLERIRKRNGNHQNDIILTEQTASTYYDHFQPPTDEEGEVIVVEGY